MCLEYENKHHYSNAGYVNVMNHPDQARVEADVAIFELVKLRRPRPQG